MRCHQCQSTVCSWKPAGDVTGPFLVSRAVSVFGFCSGHVKNWQDKELALQSENRGGAHETYHPQLSSQTCEHIACPQVGAGRRPCPARSWGSGEQPGLGSIAVEELDSGDLLLLPCICLDDCSVLVTMFVAWPSWGWSWGATVSHTMHLLPRVLPSPARRQAPPSHAPRMASLGWPQGAVGTEPGPTQT